MIIRILFAIACFCTLIAEAVPPYTIATEGDSITAGVPYFNSNGNGCTGCGGYQPPLHTLLVGSGWSPTIYNFGIPGESSTTGAGRVPGILNSHDPDFLLYMEGTNNLFFVSPATVQADYISVIQNTQNAGKIPVIGTLLPDTRNDNNTLKNINGTNTLIKALAGTYEIEVADLNAATSFNGWKNIYLSSDGLHPNTSGYALMANVWHASLLLAAVEDPNVIISPIIMLLLS